MRQIISKQSGFLSVRLMFIMATILLVGPVISNGQYLKDTFEDDTVGNFPNGPEIGSALYSGSGAYSHGVINDSGDQRLRSKDNDPGGGISISYTPIAGCDKVAVRYEIKIESGGSLSGQNAFVQQMILTPGGTNISMDWTNIKDWTFVITRPVGGNITINTLKTWVLDTTYVITLHIDTVNDTFSVDMFDGMADILTTTPIGYDATGFSRASFSSNWGTTGSQVIDDVTITRDCGGGPCIWYVDADAAGANNGASWTDAFIRLQDALTVAQADDEVWVAEGAYRPDQGVGYSANDRSAWFVLENDVAVYGGFDGTETIRDQRDWLANETILTGQIGSGAIDTDNSFHVAYSDNNDPTAILDGFTITKGYADGGIFPANFGGGMLFLGASPTVSNCFFYDNQGNTGSGCAVLESGGNPSLFNCIFMDNTSLGAGGGIENQGSSMTLRSCMFLGNTAGTGGAIRVLNSYAASTYTNCVFSGNISTTNGGAISNAGTVGGHIPPELINCSLNENSAAGDGGGIHNNGGDDVTLNSCILWANSDAGGADESAQFFASSLTPTIEFSCLQGWTGGWGGPGNIGADPQFVDPDGLDDVLGNLDDNLRLEPASPCIDTGDPDPLMNDTDGTRNDMGAYGGPGAQVGGIGVFPGSGFLFTDVGIIPRAEITQDSLNPDLLIGTANGGYYGGITSYVNTAFGRNLYLWGLFGDLDTSVDYYQVMLGTWDGTTPPSPTDPNDWETLDKKLVKVLYTYNEILGEWEHEYVTLGPQLIDGVEDLYQLTTTGFWSFLSLRIIWNTRNHPDGLYTLTVTAYNEVSPGVLNDITASLGNVGEIILRVDNTPVTTTIHNLKYDPNNPYYIPVDDGEITECSIINLGSDDENIRFTITASHPHGFLRQFTLDTVYGKNQNGGIVAQKVYSNPPPLWNGVTNREYQSKYASDPPGNLQPWVRCAYQFRLRVWPRITNGFGYLGHSEFSDHYFLDLPGVLNCAVYDYDNNSFINLIDFWAFSNYWLESCIIR